VSEVLRRDGVLDRVGKEHIHGNVYRAVQAQADLRATPRGS
jgi:hypothetical protein